MRILVAGATGAIGRLLVPMLVADGHEVTGTSRTDHGVAAVEALGAHGVRADALDAAGVRTVVLDARPEVVVHQLTALGERDFTANSRIRVEGTRNLVDAALEAGTRRIVAQSVSWVYEPGDAPADETTPLDADPARAGLLTGINALEEGAARLPEHVVLRYGLLYGPGTWYTPGGWIAEQLRAGTPAATATDGVASFVHVEDAARAAVAALAWPSGAVNVVDDEPAAGRDWLPALAKAFGEPEPAYQPGRAGWERGASNRKARTELGWTPTRPSWRTGFGAEVG